MLLCVNIGNSNIVVGLHGEKTWQSHWRLDTVSSRTADEYELFIRPFLSRAGISIEHVEALALASVVPRLTETFSLLSRHMFHCDPFFISSQIETGLDFSIDNTGELGADLIANAVAGYSLVNEGGSAKKGVIIVDFGTALTFTVVSRSAQVLGAVIAPGLNGALNSLAGDTAQLPHVKLEPPPRTIGTNTIHSIQSGVIFGFTGLVESMVARIRNEMGSDAAVVATGGLHHVVAGNTNCFNYIEPWLHLEGIREIYLLNSK